MEGMTELEIMERYRFSRAGINYLEDLIGDDICPRAPRNNALSARHKILITLRYLATGPIQLNDADLHGCSQPTVSRVLTEVIEALSSPKIVQQFIKFPTTPEECKRASQQIAGLANFPMAIGAIDGTHIPIIAPRDQEEVYVNRKGFHSLNVQLVFDGFNKITNVVARWPGSVHDSRILRESSLHTMFETGIVPRGYHLLGDSGYGAKRWLLTPYLDPQTPAQMAYNRYVRLCGFINFIVSIHHFI
jgi:hypothetical protein